MNPFDLMEKASKAVASARLPLELGRALNWAAEIRLIADYSGDEVTADKARQVIEQADFFVTTVRKQLEPHEPHS